MMQHRLYLLFALLFVLVVSSLNADQKSAKDDSAFELKKKTYFDDNNDDGGGGNRKMKMKNKPKHKSDDYDDEDVNIDENYSALVADSFSRYSPSNTADSNYRTRPRWSPSQSSQLSEYDEASDANDWFRNSFGNNFLSLPPITMDIRPPTSNTPQCYSLIDPQYAIFSDICGAVPQARYSLPNAFGHRERWQIAQSLTSLISSSTDSSCLRSLRLLLCPVLFPPCPTRNEQPPVLPCQSFCRVVKTRCAIPALEFLPCEVLPHSSDLCPTNQPFTPFNPQSVLPTMGHQPHQSFSPFNPQSILPTMTQQPHQSFSPFNQQSILPTMAQQPNQPYSPFNPQSILPTMTQQQQMQNGFPSFNYLAGQAFPSFQSLLASQTLQPTPLTPPANPAQSQQSPLQTPSTQTKSHTNLYNGAQYGTDSLPQMFLDFAPRQSNDYLQASNYAPFLRSSNEVAPTAGTRFTTGSRSSTAQRPTVVQSFVKA